MTGVDAAGEAADFFAKWRGAWPEWPIAAAFIPAPQRACIEAWQALQFEWQEAAWRGDARPGELKLQWWVEELAGWSDGRRRHPLGAVLQRHPAPWRELASALPSLAATRGRPHDGAHAWAALEPLATRLAHAESALLDGASDPRAVAATWLHARLARHPDDAVPTDVADSAAWGDALLRHWPACRGLTPSRGVMLALARARLARGAAAAPLSPLSTVWAAWRGARR